MVKLVDRIEPGEFGSASHEKMNGEKKCDAAKGHAHPERKISPETSLLLDTCGKDFHQYVYEDKESGLSLWYNVFLPEQHDENTLCPMVVFLGDAATVGEDVKKPLHNLGALIFASKEEQQKQPCVVLVPQYPGVILDDHGEFLQTPYVELTARLIKKAVSLYLVDPARVYGTGQSMGCMTTMILHAEYENLFAACMFVDGQWDYAELENLAGRRFLYFAAEGDYKAHKALEDLSVLWEKLGAHVSRVTLDAKEPVPEQERRLKDTFASGDSIICVTWKLGSVLPEGTPIGTMEHNDSFDHPYRLGAARNWLMQFSGNND